MVLPSTYGVMPKPAPGAWWIKVSGGSTAFSAAPTRASSGTDALPPTPITGLGKSVQFVCAALVAGVQSTGNTASTLIVQGVFVRRIEVSRFGRGAGARSHER